MREDIRKIKSISVVAIMLLAAFVAGIASLLIEKCKKEKVKTTPKTLYSELQKILK